MLTMISVVQILAKPQK